MKKLPRSFIETSSKSLDKFIGGGFQPGSSWLFVTDHEAESAAVSAICMMSFNFVARGYPTLIMATRHSWPTSMESYRKAIPDIAETLGRASKEGRLLVANFFTTPKYKPILSSELYFDSMFYSTEVVREMTNGLKAIKTGGKPIFWRLSSVSDLARHWPEGKVADTLESLLAWFHKNNAIGVATINQELAPEMLVKRMTSLFPNVAYVNTELKENVEHNIWITKSINLKASAMKRKFMLTSKYKVLLK